MLKNVLIVVDDIEKSIEFYKDLFGMQVILKNEGNVILSEGLVLRDADIWGKILDETSTPFNNMMELYFEDFDIQHRRYFMAKILANLEMRALLNSLAKTMK
ncbi:VOC family protein [Dorea ammoniilytica]|uniref:VOC family protein n=1 Tax=Dorea ammoniilytica TaxID=2981788 RepID=A0ABT2S8N5_9FIRM|nr:VOC family protein [Dorea ammoniilytica]MCU6700944.1 VOC family protein [Dorea ammoniilytica]SCI10094.1 Glyoxalase-like domain [uncultured Eubacterium sp.]